MKLRPAVQLFLFAMLSPAAWAQTADDYVAWGRSHLANSDMIAANAAFSLAVAADPQHETANALYGLSRLLTIADRKPGSDFLDRLGFPAVGRSIYGWTSQPQVDKEGMPLIPAGLDANEFALQLRTNLLPALVFAQARLAKVSSPAFQLNLTSAETHSTGVTVDYGDIQMIRAILYGFEYLIHSTYDWNLHVQAEAIKALHDSANLNIQQVWSDFPQLLTYATTNDLAAAAAAFQNAASRYAAASMFIRDRSPLVTRLFNLDDSQAEAEAQFRTTLMELANSWNGPVPLSLASNHTVFLGVQKTNNHPPRYLLPEFRQNSFVLGSLPDPGFGGLVQGLHPDEIDSWLGTYLRGIPSFASAGKETSGFECSVRVTPGRGYMVQISSDLLQWTDYFAVAPLDGVVTFSDPEAGERRFYRLLDCTEQMPIPSNDNFSNRTVISGISAIATGYVGPATTEALEPDGWIGSVWWTWTAPASGTFVVSLEGSLGDIWGRVYTGNSLNLLSPVAYDGEPFTAVAGTSYQIQVMGWELPGAIQLRISTLPVLMVTAPADGSVWSTSTDIALSATAYDFDGIKAMSIGIGDVELTNSASGAISAVTNLQPGFYTVRFMAEDNFGMIAQTNCYIRVSTTGDNFAERIPIPGNSATVNGSNLAGSHEPLEPKHTSYGGEASSWWSWTAPSNGVVSVYGSLYTVDYWHYYDDWDGKFYHGYDIWEFGSPVVGVYTGAFLDSLTRVATNTSGGTAMVSFTAAAGTEYSIVVDERYGQSGPIRLELAGFAPVNDNLKSSIQLSGTECVTNGCNYKGTSEPGEPNHAGRDPASSIWWSWQAPSNGAVRISAQMFDGYRSVGSPSLAVYTGSQLSNLTSIAGVFAPRDGAPAELSFSASAGAVYRIAVAEQYGQTGSIRLRIGAEPATALLLGSTLTGLNALPGCRAYYKVHVPAGTPAFRIYSYGGYGDCDLYVKHGTQPRFNSWDYRPYMEGNQEAVIIPNPAEGEWHIMLDAYDSYEDLRVRVW